MLQPTSGLPYYKGYTNHKVPLIIKFKNSFLCVLLIMEIALHRAELVIFLKTCASELNTENTVITFIIKFNLLYNFGLSVAFSNALLRHRGTIIYVKYYNFTPCRIHRRATVCANNFSIFLFSHYNLKLGRVLLFVDRINRTQQTFVLHLQPQHGAIGNRNSLMLVLSFFYDELSKIFTHFTNSACEVLEFPFMVAILFQCQEKNKRKSLSLTKRTPAACA